jgi:hypothetical protein
MLALSGSGAREHIRKEVFKLCSSYGDDYWRKLDRENTYPSEFVQPSPWHRLGIRPRLHR